MADTRRLAEKILSDPKIADKGNSASKVYRDEPILFTIPRKENFTPPKIREMRKLARGNWVEAKIFYEQGRFMEYFEDDFEYQGEFVQYFPTYQAMSDVQLRGYFSWRTKVRGGAIEKTSLSFAFVYIYELLNRIGVHSPEEGFRTLKAFWAAYGEIDSRINSYVAVWLKDYAVYNNLDRSFLDGLPDIDFDNAVAVLLEYASHGAEEVFHALNSLSSYDLADSRFFKQYPDDVKNVVHRVFAVISDYYNKNPKNSAREKLFGRICISAYAMFKSAVFYHQPQRENRVYEIGNSHRYICRNGSWRCERFVWYGQNNKRIGALLKTIDFLMRQSYGYKSTLQPGKVNKVLRAKIEKEIQKYELAKRENAPAKIDIDVSKLHGIRIAALTTQSKLLVEEPESETPIVAPEKPVHDKVMGLNGDEIRFMQCLVSGKQYDGIKKARGLMLSVLIDGINEKLFEVFNDTVIVDDGDGPKVIEDYMDELKGMIPE